MATSKEYIKYVIENIDPVFNARSRAMFGEYMVYCDDRPVLTVCDNTVYVKMLPLLNDIMCDCDRGYPYDGSKEHYILDIDDAELTHRVIGILVNVTPVPKKRKKAEK